MEFHVRFWFRWFRSFPILVPVVPVVPVVSFRLFRWFRSGCSGGFVPVVSGFSTCHKYDPLQTSTMGSDGKSETFHNPLAGYK